MKVYVVSRMCDDEYFCTEVVFVTHKEEIAKQYCEKHNVVDKCWDGEERDTITYEEYELVRNIETVVEE